MRDICIVGVGSLGGALAIGLSKAGWNVRELGVRNDEIAKRIKRSVLPEAQIRDIGSIREISSKAILIAVDDPEIENVASAITPFISSLHIVLHTSGSQSSSILSEVRNRGAAAGSLHPLASISDPFAKGRPFDGVFFGIEGDRRATTLGKRIASALGGKPFSIPGDGKALYHAAAVAAAGHVAALFDSAVQMMVFSGQNKKQATRILLPLIQSTISNLATQQAENALTGTFSRLDIQTFLRHLSSFDNLPPKIAHLYLELGDRSLDLVEKREGKSKSLEEFRVAISIAKRKYRC